MIDAFHYSCEGESHKAINKVGQDYSFSSIVDDLAVAIVCDGHGGDRYFRSDIGSRCAVEATLEAVTFFVAFRKEEIHSRRTDQLSKRC